MPTISNATVATGTGLSTAGNGGRKLVRLSNKWLVSTAHNLSATRHVLYVSKDEGATWSQLCFVTMGSFTVANASLVAKGTDVYLFTSTNSNVYCQRFDTLTVTNTEQYNASNFGISLEQSMGGTSLAINEAGTELHAAWSSKNATYPNSFNIRYAKGTINGDGSVTWGAVEQVTISNVSSYANYATNPTLVFDKNGVPCIFVQHTTAYPSGSSVVSGNTITLYKRDSSLTIGTSSNYTSASWSFKSVFIENTHAQSNPSAIFVPQSINGLANGRLWVAWHGKDATGSAKFNVRVSYSDDGGSTWATPVKLTSGNLYDRQNVSLAADKTGKVFALYEEHQRSPDLDIYMRTFSGGSWGAPVAVAEADPAAESNPSALVDYSLQMTTPPFVFMSGTTGIRFTGNFNVGASVSPASGALGNKETATLTAYTVTPEAGSTVTQIVERVNGVTVNTFNNPASLSRTLTVPTATWDTLAYFATHTASITVTDSNGAQTVTTYSFDKRLATNASLLEATKANTDAKNRISQKRDALAAQVGLSAGSTFDAIGAQLASGQAFKKFQPGVSTSNANGVITVTSLSFKPTLVFAYPNNPLSDYRDTALLTSLVSATNNVYINNSNQSITYTLASLTDTGFTVCVQNPNSSYNWIAFG